MLRLINQTLSQIILMCEKQRGILQCWTLINVPGRHGADSVQTQVGLTELWCIRIAPNGGEVAELLTTLCYRSPGSSHPLKWSPAKEYKRVKQADYFLLSFLFIKQVCYRVLMQLCGQYGHPALAVKVSILDRSDVLVLAYRTSWTSSEQSKRVDAMETSLWAPLLFFLYSHF